MKKLLALLLAAIMVFAMVSCTFGNSGDDDNDDKNSGEDSSSGNNGNSSDNKDEAIEGPIIDWEMD